MAEVNNSPEDRIELEAANGDILRERNVASEVENEASDKVELYNAQEGLVTRSGGPYLDDLEREAAELRRARIEGREPDLKNPGPHVGTLLVTKDQLVERDASRSHGLARGTEPDVKPMESYDAEVVEESKPDPRQRDFDNDTQTYRGDWDNDTQTDGGVPDEKLKGETSYDGVNSPIGYEGPVEQPNFQDKSDDNSDLDFLDDDEDKK